MKPEPVMTLPNARFSTFVTLNCKREAHRADGKQCGRDQAEADG